MESLPWWKDDEYWEEVSDENAEVRCVQELPEGWTAIHLRALLPLMQQRGASAAAVLLAMVDAAEPYTQDIQLSLRECARRAGVSIGTVIRAVQTWESQGVLFKTSFPHQDFRWRLNPHYSCKVFPHGE